MIPARIEFPIAHKRSLTKAVSAAAFALPLQYAAAQVFHLPPTSPVFGLPYADLGLEGRHTWELYRKTLNPSDLTVTGSGVAGNNTLVELTNQKLGSVPGSGSFIATGQIFLANTPAATPSTDILYLKDVVVEPGTAGYDENGHGEIEIRFGFLQNASAYITARGGDNHDTDLYGGNRGTNGVYMRVAASNTIRTENPDGNWLTSGQNRTYLFGGTTGSEGDLNGASAFTTADPLLINSETTPSMIGGGFLASAGYNSPLEISAKLIADTSIPGNVLIQAKLGGNIVSSSFNPNDPVFGPSGFAWQTARPIVFLANAAFDQNPAAKLHMGVLAPGDANGDARVNAFDVGAVKASFNSSDRSWSNGDFTQDGVVNAFDVGIVKQKFNQPVGATASDGEELAVALAELGEIELLVDLETGNIKLRGQQATISGYEIHSNGNNLLAANWISLTMQGASAQGFSEFSRAGNDVAEFSFGGTYLTDGLVDIGNAFKVGGDQDLEFLYNNELGNTLVVKSSTFRSLAPLAS